MVGPEDDDQVADAESQRADAVCYESEHRAGESNRASALVVDDPKARDPLSGGRAKKAPSDCEVGPPQ